MERFKFLIVLLMMAFILNAQDNNPQIRALTNAAESGDLQTQKYLADLYLKGSVSVQKNVYMAYKWYLRAAKQNDAESMYILASDEDLRPFVNEDRTRIYWLEQAAKSCHPFAIEDYGNYLIIEKKDPKAFQFFSDMKDGKYGTIAIADGGVFLAYCYYYGVGVETDLMEAMNQFTELYKMGKELIAEYPKLVNVGKRLVRLTSYPMGEVYKFAGMDSTAYYLWEECYSLDDTKIDLVTELGWIKYGWNDFYGAEQWFQKAVNIDDNKTKAEGYNGLAYIAVNRNPSNPNYKLAHTFIDKSISLVRGNKKKSIRYLDSKGEFYLLAKETDNALMIWKNILELNSLICSNSNSTFVKFMCENFGADKEGLGKESQWTGTGWSINGGYIITNCHVAEDAKTIYVNVDSNGKKSKYKARVIALDKTNDLAVLYVDELKNVSIPYSIRSSSCSVGEKCYSLGYPLSHILGNELKLTDGVISSKSGFEGDLSVYQVSAATQPGNSGCPLIDENGNVIGVVNAGVPSADNVSYAIKMSYVITLLQNHELENYIPTSGDVRSIPELPGKVKILRNFIYLLECSNREE